MSFDAIVNQDKAIASFPDWQLGENSALWFNAPLEIGGVVESGIMLHGEARIDMPNRNVGLELLYQIPQTKKRFALARLGNGGLAGIGTRTGGVGPFPASELGRLPSTRLN